MQIQQESTKMEAEGEMVYTDQSDKLKSLNSKNWFMPYLIIMVGLYSNFHHSLVSSYIYIWV